MAQHITSIGPGVDIDSNSAAARAYAAAVQSACTKLAENPFCLHARVEMLRLIVKESIDADITWARLMVEHDASP